MCEVHNVVLLEAKAYLKDHPRTCKWLITMVIVVVPQMGLFLSWIKINGGDPNYLTTYDTWDDPPSMHHHRPFLNFSFQQDAVNPSHFQPLLSARPLEAPPEI